MYEYQAKKDYKTDRNNIDIILKKLDQTSYKKIHYIGYADKDLVISLKDKYQVSLGDYFDRTNKSTAFYRDGMTDDGRYILDGTPIELNIPEWAEDIFVMRVESISRRISF